MTALPALAAFLASALLFAVQPMVGRALLPLLGGVPAVWNTCMVFFQATVLLGSLWAHGTSRPRLPVLGLALHGALWLAALLTLPLGVPTDTRPPPDGNPILFLGRALPLLVGLPALVVAATPALLQRWLAASERWRGHDPYRLYAASNAGALLALLAYPTLVEPAWGLADQFLGWSAAFALLAAIVACCTAWLAPWRPSDAARSVGVGVAIDGGVDVGVEGGAGVGVGVGVGVEDEVEVARSVAVESERDDDAGRARCASVMRAQAPTGAPHAGAATGGPLRWVLLSAVPAALLLGVTQHLTRDITSMPLLWVGPLALYLASFVVAFAPRGARATRVADALLPVAVLAAAALVTLPERGTVALQVGVHSLALALGAASCHGRLAASRPPPLRLTGFYVWVSLGGLLGGAFVALVAPLVFDDLHEYPLALLGLALLRVPRGAVSPRRLLAVGAQAAAVAGAVWTAHVLAAGIPATGLLLGIAPAGWVAMAPPLLVGLLAVRRPRALAASLLVLLVLPPLLRAPDEVLHRQRTFFGTRMVLRQPYGQGAFHVLVDGTTVHGAQYDSPPWADLPLTYFGSASPVADVFAALEARGRPARVAVVGLGVGSLALQGRPGWRMTFFEVDPGIAAIATDPALFSCVERSPAEVEIVLGDARLRLAEQPRGAFDLIVLDAFNSESVPVHLLTVEAVQGYLQRLAPQGLLAFNVTNVSLDLAPVIAAAAERLGLIALGRQQTQLDELERRMQQAESAWVVLARAAEHVDRERFARWSWLLSRPDRPAWTDDHASVMSALR